MLRCLRIWWFLPGLQKDVQDTVRTSPDNLPHRDEGAGRLAVKGCVAGQDFTHRADPAMGHAPISFFYLPGLEKSRQGSCRPLIMGKQDESPGFTVQAVDKLDRRAEIGLPFDIAQQRTVIPEATALGQHICRFVPDAVVFLPGDEMGDGRDPAQDLSVVVEGEGISCLQLKFRLADPLLFAAWPFEPHGAFLHGVLDGDFRDLAGCRKKIGGIAVRGDGDMHRALRGGTICQNYTRGNGRSGSCDTGLHGPCWPVPCGLSTRRSGSAAGGDRGR